MPVTHLPTCVYLPLCVLQKRTCHQSAHTSPHPAVLHPTLRGVHQIEPQQGVLLSFENLLLLRATMLDTHLGVPLVVDLGEGGHVSLLNVTTFTTCVIVQVYRKQLLRDKENVQVSLIGPSNELLPWPYGVPITAGLHALVHAQSPKQDPYISRPDVFVNKN